MVEDIEYIKKLEQFLNNNTEEQIINIYKDVPDYIIRYINKSN